MSTTDAVAFRDGVYAARPAASGPQPNARLTETVMGLPPGDALDLGCGDGGGALWLARQGWQVTAVDLAPQTWAVERADAPRRIATGPDGRTAEVTDHVLLVRRTA
jgi:2-polyprenyl-3-methyl-5-hydroxy-6-metoxy-1,4-benzoquinol methylase